MYGGGTFTANYDGKGCASAPAVLWGPRGMKLRSQGYETLFFYKFWSIFLLNKHYMTLWSCTAAVSKFFLNIKKNVKTDRFAIRKSDGLLKKTVAKSNPSTEREISPRLAPLLAKTPLRLSASVFPRSPSAEMSRKKVASVYFPLLWFRGSNSCV